MRLGSIGENEATQDTLSEEPQMTQQNFSEL